MTHAPEACPSAPSSAAFRASVVVPMRNREAFIAPLLESLCAQWRPDLELILIDDASEDATLAKAMQVLEGYPAIECVTVRLAQRQGMQVIATLLAIARGRILIQADSDDIAFKGRLARVLRCFEEDEDCRLVTSNAVLVSPEGLLCGLYDTRLPDTVVRHPQGGGLAGWSVRHLGATMAYHRDVFDLFPPIDAELCPYGLDLIVPLRAVLVGSHHYLATPLVGWRQHRANTHRLAGTHASDLAASERYRALEMMALAQNLRDVESFCSLRPTGFLEPLMTELRASFSLAFDQWSRLRTRLMRDGVMDRLKAPEAVFMPAIPPILSLRIGDTLFFSRSDARSSLVAAGTGFHQPEDWGLWTQRIALFSLRLDAAGSSLVRLDFKFVAPGGLAEGRFAISVDGEHWTEGSNGDQLYFEMSIVCNVTKPAPIVGIIIVAHDAAVPRDLGSSVDDRLIGAGLVSLRALAVDERTDRPPP